MNFTIIYLFITVVLIFADASTPARRRYRGYNAEISDTFGDRVVDSKSTNQTKRDTSLSYAATNIDSKEGTRVKTITVIKNHSGKSSGKLVINPELHKNEEWANAFRDNFDTYGGIPDVPNIDDLFEFVKRKTKNDDQNKKEVAKPKPKDVSKTDHVKPIEESSEIETTTEPVRKITGDAELVPELRKNQTSARSQSLGMDEAGTLELNDNFNDTSSEESKEPHFEKYLVKEVPKGYDYPKPCPKGGKSVVSVTNPSSGRTYDIPVEEDSPATPYIAPSVTKKSQLPGLQSLQNNTQNFASTFVRPTFSVNSILPPLQPNLDNQQTQQGAGFYTSQRPYIAPNLRNGFNANSAPTLRPLYRNDITTYRGNTYFLGTKRVNAARSRGLKY